jgi:hypothetical protein
VADKLQLELEITGFDRVLDRIEQRFKAIEDMANRMGGAGASGSAKGGATSGGSPAPGGGTFQYNWQAQQAFYMTNLLKMMQTNFSQFFINNKQFHRNFSSVFNNQTHNNQNYNNTVIYNLLKQQEQRSRGSHLARELMGSAASTAKWAGLGISGLTAVGIHKSVSGAQLENEIGGISRELANIFAPLVQRLTRTFRGLRDSMSKLTEQEQNNLMRTGLIAAGAVLLRKPLMAAAGLALPYAAAGAGRLLGGATTMLGGGLAGAGRLGAIGATAYLGYKTYSTLSDLSASRREPVSDREFIRAGFTHRIGGDARNELIERHRREYNAEYGRLNQERRDRTWIGMGLSTLGVNPVNGTGAFGYSERIQALNRRARIIMDAAGGRDPGSRRQERFADNVGYGGVGSSSDALQEEMVRTGTGISPQGPSEAELLQHILSFLTDDLPRFLPGGPSSSGSGVVSPPSG